MEELFREIGERGDLAHLVLFVWASSASTLLALTLRELIASNRRFDDFVAAIARINGLFGGYDRKG
ncbi:hypothetical protein GR183_12420 [Stappia sp. GBMRC 2046]|uniref:Uncharacterized protein n=1 Tax=Stappia sediminis TaxID=2692190 RepID=A0A7X3LV68_9HYPH|nr:hypothetical protein [Stappia sediminis]MXN65711.1 hypothetical protein [Stappia sediminis]